jgi:hypothetical protein
MDVMISDLNGLMFYLFTDPTNKHLIKTCYYKLKGLNYRHYPILKDIIEEQKQKELLLEEVLKSKNNIGGLIEDKIRSFVYYKTHRII